MARFVRKDRRIYDFSSCTCCGTAWGGYSAKKCPPTTCLACGTTQCLGNGLARGQCSVCYTGLLPGWGGTDRPCKYKGCKRKAVTACPRKGYCCAEHARQNGTAEKIAAALAERDRTWVEIQD